MYRGNDGLFRACHCSDKAQRRRYLVPLPRVCQEVFQVVARGKAIAVAVQQHCSHTSVALTSLEGLRQRAVHRGGQRVLLLRTVDRDAQHICLQLALYLAHNASPDLPCPPAQPDRIVLEENIRIPPPSPARASVLVCYTL